LNELLVYPAQSLCSVSTPPTPSSDNTDPLEAALRQFLQVYQDIPAEDRPLKLKCLSQRYDTSLVQEIGMALSDKNSHSLPFLANYENKENNEKNSVTTMENVPIKLDWNVLDFFTNSTCTGDDVGEVLADKDMELWNSTLQDFLVFED